MNHNQLSRKICQHTNRGYLLYSAGIEGLYHLGEENVKGLHLIDATPEQVLQFVENNK